MAARKTASIIIPNYNGREHLQRLLPSIAGQTAGNYEVIIVDDCSPDRSAVEYVRTFIKDYDNMRLIENEDNLGFVKTCNKGLKLAEGNYICTLNNDTKLESNFVERNVQVMDEDSSIGVLSCVIVDQYGNNWFSGGSFKSGVRVNLRDDFLGVRTVDWVAGTAPFYRKDLFAEVGLLDETFVMYHEDVEFCLRVRHKTRYSVCMFSDKLVTHYVQDRRNPTFDTAKRLKLSYYGHRNNIVLLKTYSRGSIPKALLRHLLDIIILAMVGIRRFKPLFSVQAAIFVVRGTIDGLRTKQNRQVRSASGRRSHS